ncbi:hypothetical protein [Chryseobacterium sp. HSC-36S06]|uniref:hypothetical protein n=1 Tax=Chryseobacterium sp. HSC-36S06 TaxID=2910970 RepID=UPI00209CF0D1|nr:hypothetical protein [Chryseobacterium sp. HSC-36S06]MCP2037931.1 hypothetical protein [Chryseobacterium sp. HSC-36S06]
MKKLNIFLFSLIVVTVFVACGTREDELSNEQFVGTWNWAATTGGIGNINDTPASTGIQRTITFTDTYIYTVKENDATVSEGTYNLLKEVTPNEHKEKLFIDFSNYPDVFVDGIDSSNLYLGDHTNDGYSYHYKK